MYSTFQTAHLVLSALPDLPTTHLAAPPTSALSSTITAAPDLAVKTLPQVVSSLRAWIMGILAGVATLFAVIGALRYVMANGDPAAIEQAKGAFKAALTGYALAVLAPVILQVLQGILGA